MLVKQTTIESPGLSPFVKRVLTKSGFQVKAKVVEGGINRFKSYQAYKDLEVEQQQSFNFDLKLIE